VIGEADRADVGGFLARLVRIAPASVVRLRPPPPGAAVGPGETRIWAFLPFQVLVNRPLRVPTTADVTVDATELLGALTEGRDLGSVRRRDQAWRWPLPPAQDEVVETIPAADVIRLAAAASRTLRTALAEGVGGRAVGERAVRDALLDHVAVVVTTESGERVEVRQRLIQAIVRMGLLGRVGAASPDVAISPDTGAISPDAAAISSGVATPIADTDRGGQVTVRRAMGWTGLCGLHGCAWYRPISPLRLG
jgi:hypothetical protein